VKGELLRFFALIFPDFRSKVIIDSFVFVVIFTGEKNWHERAFFIEELRALIDEYPQFNVTVFDYDSTM
jgi:hypothetical protein